MRSVAIALILLGFPSGSIGCSCIDVGLTGQYANADIVFEGVVYWTHSEADSNSTDKHIQVLHVLVGRVYKGAVAGTSVLVRTTIYAASCGAYLPIGGRYLLFGYQAENVAGSHSIGPFVLGTTMCMGNRFYPIWRFSLRKNIKRLSRGEAVPKDSRWSQGRSF